MWGGNADLAWHIAHQYPLSTQSLSSSRGGRKPNGDFCGMLRSSMKATSFLPPMGANTPLVRFSSLPSIVSWEKGGNRDREGGQGGDTQVESRRDREGTALNPLHRMPATCTLHPVPSFWPPCTSPLPPHLQ